VYLGWFDLVVLGIIAYALYERFSPAGKARQKKLYEASDRFRLLHGRLPTKAELRRLVRER